MIDIIMRGLSSVQEVRAWNHITNNVHKKKIY